MWLLYAAGSAVFAGVTAVLAKCGIRSVNSNLATAVRTVVVLGFSWLMVFVAGSQGQLSSLTPKTVGFLVLSGLATGASWLCYFRALQLGSIDQVTPIDKSSTVLTILLAFLFFGEFSVWKTVGAAAIGLGTCLMIQKKGGEKGSLRFLPYALLSALFASLTSILGKIGIENVDANLGTAIRTGVVLAMAWLVVFLTGAQKGIGKIDGKSWAFLCLSGVTTGASWLCYYHALQQGPASVVVPVDKLSIVITVAFSRIFFGERLTRQGAVGLLLIVAGTMVLLI